MRLAIVNLAGHVAHISPDKIDHVKGVVTDVELRNIKDCALYETLNTARSLEQYFSLVVNEQSKGVVTMMPAPESDEHELLMASPYSPYHVVAQAILQ